MRPDVDTLTARLARVTDAEAGLLVDGDVRTQLASRITMSPPADGGSSARSARRHPGSRARLRRAPLLVASGIAVAAVVLGAGVATHSPARSPGPIPPGPQLSESPALAALVFVKHGDSIDVIIRDPLADPARYNKEFAARGLHITLSTAPVGRANVGSFVFMEVDGGDDRPITPIYSNDRCRQPAGNSGGGAECEIGLRIPADYRGSARIVVGRPAVSGDIPEDGGDNWAVQGSYAGVRIDGRRVFDVLNDLRRKGIVVTEFRYEYHGSDQPYPDGVPPMLVPGYWWVHDAAPGSTNEPILFVGPEKD